MITAIAIVLIVGGLVDALAVAVARFLAPYLIPGGPP